MLTKVLLWDLFLPSGKFFFNLFYQVEIEDYGSFILWSEFYTSNWILSINEIVNRVDRAIRSKRFSKTLLVLNEKVDNNPEFLAKYNLIAFFDETIKRDESLYIYRLASQSCQND